jgi:hypothetical protein
VLWKRGLDGGRAGKTVRVEGLTEPLPRGTRVLLRRAVRDHVASERRRSGCPTVLHVGRPGGTVASLDLADAEPTDPGLRTDLVAALRVRAGAAPDHLVWLTRWGDLELQDVDAQWLAAARAAYAEAQVPLTFVVVTRRGWRDPRSGVSRTWARVRTAG